MPPSVAIPSFAPTPAPEKEDPVPLSTQINNHAASSTEGPAQRPNSSGSVQSGLRAPLMTNAPQSRALAQASSTHNSVMHETLSVIDEHITDLRTPRQSRLSTATRNNQDADSIYSSHAGSRFSYINGHESDEEEPRALSEAEVMTWTPARVAEYLEDHGVEKDHCDFFREQDMSGDVLLQMDQSTIFIQQFDLGTFGRRLKTWQKVKALQDEVRSRAPPTGPRSISDYSAAGDDSLPDVSRVRSTSITAAAAAPPRPSTAVPSSSNHSPLANRKSLLQSSSIEPRNSIFDANANSENALRPSAASIRSLNHSRRHSSVGSLDLGPLATSSRLSQQRPPSTSIMASGSASAAARRRSLAQEHTISADLSQYESTSGGHNNYRNSLTSPPDLDRGYFSGNEVDKRNKRNVLQKKTSPMHSRNTSLATAQSRAHVRMPSTDSMRAPNSPILSPGSAHFSFNRSSGTRTVSSPPLNALQGPASPMVTKLDYGQPATLADSDTSSVNPSPSPASHNFSFFSKPRVGGLRIASDAVTQNEKRAQSGLKGSPITSPTRTGSTTPSTETQSFELQKRDTQSRVSTGSSSALAPPLPNARNRTKTKTKKTTSAYTRGLEKKSPAEQMEGCDYSGWMKKKSSNLMGSWKPRLFVLRGRRLSYYYSENDTEEKGLIDISSHRVLPAENERITGIHATLTGASSPVVPGPGSTQTAAATDLAAKPIHVSDQGLFIFKLVPPRQGLSKAVNFTKPTVHYFAVNSRQEGRLWMAALMKATIDYDPSGKLVTSYNQKTISLAKARARNERPPALRDAVDQKDNETALPAELDGVPMDDSASSGGGNPGLGIGLALAESNDSTEQTALGGAERD